MADQDPLRADLDEFYSNYVQLAARVLPAQGQGGRRPQPSSRAPLQVQMVSLMDEGRRLLAWFNGQAKFLLNPYQRIELTKREGVRCPHCGADLVAHLWPEHPDRSEIVCTGLDHRWEDGPSRWPPSEWKRLGVLVGTHEDGRFSVERDSGAA